MDQKTLTLIEYPKILEKLADYAAFGTSAELALTLRPADELQEVRERLSFTREARLLLSMNPDIRIGGVHDIREIVEHASRHYVMSIEEMVDTKGTLIAARKLQKPFFSKRQDDGTIPEHINPDDLREDSPEMFYPHLVQIARKLTPPFGIIDRITQVISEEKQVLDNASKLLSQIRSELKVAHNRLINKLQSMINDPRIMPMLQDSIITQRGGRYVIPLQAGFKGKIPAIIHDRSGTGQTLFIEPLAVVDLNNQFQELKLAEQDEVRRILAELSDEIGAEYECIKRIVNAVAEIDFALMRAKYAEDLNANGPEVLDFQPARDGSHPGSHIRMMKARHPLLPKEEVIPVDILLENPHFAMVITGPNTGGKTVTLKTTGLMIAMAQSGLHIPVQSGSQFTVFKNIYADIGDEQSIEQSLSTFSGHIKNMVHILDQANSRTLVLLDELGSGTDPQEGAALAHAILVHLTDYGIPCMVATHYPELKNFAYNNKGVVNAAMSFDLETLSPTYHLLIGLPGRSNALLIAERVGLSKTIIEIARTTINPSELRSDYLLEDIQLQKEKANEDREVIKRAREDTENLQRQLNTRLSSIEQERTQLLEEARETAQEGIKALKTELRALKKRMKRAVRYAEKAAQATTQTDTSQKRAQKEVLRQEKLSERVENQLELLEEKAEIPIRTKTTPIKPKEQTPRPLQVGDQVIIRGLEKEGTLVQMNGKDSEVQLGAMRMKVNFDQLERVSKKTEPPHGHPPSSKVQEYSISHPSPGMELNLRGERAEDAVEILIPYIEKAFLAGLPFVRIIHGKGSGRLREVVRQQLNRSSHIRNWEEAKQSEGGSGVTIVKIKTS
ncbi:MAG: endonuclease MutS2 [Anaerolineaceae bacterium]|nr:endonuclease MutS2 [Anaerolineaceae bacterium]